MNYSALQLEKFTTDIFLKLGFPPEVAVIAAQNLVRADVKGIDSHGVARLSGFVRLVKNGRINPNAGPKILYETPSTARMDADSGIGLWTAHHAMNLAIEKAKTAGSGWVAVSNSSHFGIAANHAELAIKNNMIGFVMTNASPLVAPAGSIEAYIGTNPICVGIPAGKYPPFIADLATAAAANGKLEIAQRKEEDIPTGWVQTREGSHSTNPNELKEEGTLLPLGSDVERGRHKGYALGSIVDILSGVLSGANFGRWVPPFVSFLEPSADLPGKGIGHFIGAWRIDAFDSAEVFTSNMEKWIEGARSLQRSEGIDEILIPGEPEHRMEAIRMKEGIPLTEKVIEDLRKLEEELGVNIQH